MPPLKITAVSALCLLSALSLTACAHISARTVELDYENIKEIPMEDFINGNYKTPQNSTSEEAFSDITTEIIPEETAPNTGTAPNTETSQSADITYCPASVFTDAPVFTAAPVFTDDPNKSYDGDRFLTDYFTDKEISYLHNCLFIGDSTCLGLKNYGLLNGEQVIAIPGAAARNIAGLTVTWENEEISPMAAAKNTGLNEIYCLMGLNDVNLISPEDYKNYYIDFLDRLKKSCPKANIHILSVSPVTESSEFCYNHKLDRFNEKLKEISAENGIRYMDISSVLKNEKGCMIDEYAMQDGIHFRLKAYYRILEYIIENTDL